MSVLDKPATMFLLIYYIYAVTEEAFVENCKVHLEKDTILKSINKEVEVIVTFRYRL